MSNSVYREIDNFDDLSVNNRDLSKLQEGNKVKGGNTARGENILRVIASDQG